MARRWAGCGRRSEQAPRVLAGGASWVGMVCTAAGMERQHRDMPHLAHVQLIVVLRCDGGVDGELQEKVCGKELRGTTRPRLGTGPADRAAQGVQACVAQATHAVLLTVEAATPDSSSTLLSSISNPILGGLDAWGWSQGTQGICGQGAAALPRALVQGDPSVGPQCMQAQLGCIPEAADRTCEARGRPGRVPAVCGDSFAAGKCFRCALICRGTSRSTRNLISAPQLIKIFTAAASASASRAPARHTGFPPACP